MGNSKYNLLLICTQKYIMQKLFCKSMILPMLANLTSLLKVNLTSLLKANLTSLLKANLTALILTNAMANPGHSNEVQFLYQIKSCIVKKQQPTFRTNSVSKLPTTAKRLKKRKQVTRLKNLSTNKGKNLFQHILKYLLEFCCYNSCNRHLRNA